MSDGGAIRVTPGELTGVASQVRTLVRSLRGTLGGLCFAAWAGV